MEPKVSWSSVVVGVAKDHTGNHRARVGLSGNTGST